MSKYKVDKLSEQMDEPEQTVDFVAGLRKTGPNQYKVISGTVVNGVPEVRVDHVEQSLEHSAIALKLAFRNLLSRMP